MFSLDEPLAAMGAAAARYRIELIESCASTNSDLLARAEAGLAGGAVLVAERQSAGRGRRGRDWIAAPGDSLTFSVLWRFAPGTLPAGLSLAVGVAVANALIVCGVQRARLGLKWPNDVLLDGRKLAGILIELVPGTPHAAVIGIGLNLRLPDAMPADIRATAAALDAGTPGALLGMVLRELALVLDRFAAGGFAAVQAEWMAFDAWRDRPAQLLSDFDPPSLGVCRGVAPDGALRFEQDGRIRTVLSGEISLRPVS